VAEVAIVSTPNQIQREDASRRIDVTCNVRERDLGSTAREIEERVRAMSFPQGFHPEFLGEYEAQSASFWRMVLLGLAAAAGIVLLLYSEFGAWRLVGLVMLSFVFAFIGGVLGAWIGGGLVSLGSYVGFVTVIGIAVRNGIMLISHYRHLEEHEGETFGDALTLRGAKERLAPIIMTTLTTVLALIPLVIAGNQPGHEIEFPMALVILGGLAASTLMTLFVLPSLYRAFGRV
jgi:Cu/Ag efflux pump CusA